MTSTDSQSLAPAVLNAEALGRIAEAVFIKNDLSGLNAKDRVNYARSVCDKLGLDFLTKPFDFLVDEKSGVVSLYPNKECASQLRHKYGITIKITDRQVNDHLCLITAQATMPNGRCDEAIGAVAMEKELGEWKSSSQGKKYFVPNGEFRSLSPEARANAIMRAECVPLNSEILTRAGWRTYDQVAPGDEVLAYDCASDACRWTPLLAVTVHESQPVVRLSSLHFDVLCTPEHSWAVEKSGYVPRSDGRRRRGAYANRMPDRMLVKGHELKTTHRIILAAPECGIEESVLTPAEAAVMGWAITDGTIQQRASNRRIGICQSKEQNFAPIRKVVAAVAGDVPEQVTVTESRTFPSGRTYATKPQHWWYLPAEISRELLQKAGFEDGGFGALPNLAARLSPLARKAMLQAMLLADGDKRGVFAKKKRHVIDTLQMLCALEGIALGIERGHKAVDGLIVQTLKKTRHIAVSFLRREDAGSMPVWCPTTEFGTWVMRQNGLVTITGNTKAKRRATFSLCGLGMADAPDEDAPRWDYDPTALTAGTTGTASTQAEQTQTQQPADPELERRLAQFAKANREQRLAMLGEMKHDLDQLLGNEGIAFFYDALKAVGAQEPEQLSSMNQAKQFYVALWNRLREGVPIAEEPVA